MVEIRRAESDADLEAWRRVRIAVLPNERTGTVEEIRRAASPESLYVLAELDGRVAGEAHAGRSDLAGRASLGVRVLPEARRRGVGTALLGVVASHIESLGFDEVGSSVDEPESLAFAERFGFREVDRQVEQVRVIGDETWPAPPAGVEVVRVADRPELWGVAYDQLALQAFADFALDTPLDVSLEQWERDWLAWPEGMFLAVAGGEVIGCAGLERDADEPERAENALTAVRRDWRGRGIASLLKRVSLAFAAEQGLREVYTWTQRGNADMRRLNEHLGYVTRSESITVRAPLPLPLTQRQ
jgi:N-acetylglutamate synthase-like GNAT family acetyltransferase